MYDGCMCLCYGYVTGASKDGLTPPCTLVPGYLFGQASEHIETHAYPSSSFLVYFSFPLLASKATKHITTPVLCIRPQTHSAHRVCWSSSHTSASTQATFFPELNGEPCSTLFLGLCSSPSPTINSFLYRDINLLVLCRASTLPARPRLSSTPFLQDFDRVGAPLFNTTIFSCLFK